MRFKSSGTVPSKTDFTIESLFFVNSLVAPFLSFAAPTTVLRLLFLEFIGLTLEAKYLSASIIGPLIVASPSPDCPALAGINPRESRDPGLFRRFCFCVHRTQLHPAPVARRYTSPSIACGIFPLHLCFDARAAQGIYKKQEGPRGLPGSQFCLSIFRIAGPLEIICKSFTRPDALP
jgi:hypothetical protein